MITGWIAVHTGLPSLRVVAESAKVQVLRDGESWFTVAAGETRLVSDAAAPLGTPVTYTAGGETVTLTRADSGKHLIADVNGRNQARVRAVGSDDTEIPSGVSFFDQGRSFARWPLARQYETGEMVVRTDSGDTAALAELARVKSPVFSLHSLSACEIPDCDIPSARQIVLTSARNQRTGRIDRAVREWDLSWRETDQSKGLAPVVTWGEYTDASDGWTHESYEDLCVRIAGMPPPPEWVEVGRNLSVNPGATSFTGWTQYSGGSGNILSRETIDASWSESGKAFRVTWDEVDTPNLGDSSLVIGTAFPAGTVVTVVVSTAVSRSGLELRYPNVYSNINGQPLVLARSRDEAVALVPGEVVTDWVTFIVPEQEDANLRMPFGIWNKQPGDWLEKSMGDIYEGEYQPDRLWFSGDHAPDGMRSEWLGEPNNSVSVLYEFK